MLIGLLTSEDHANYLYNINESLKLYCDTVACKLAKHPFNYENELKIIGVHEITETYKDCDLVIICHSDWELIQYLPGKRLGHVATGSKYRTRPEFINEQFKGSIQFTDQTEFMKLSNFIYLPVPIDTNKIKPIEREVKDPILFAHYPSNSGVKGSEVIDSVMVGKNYKTSRVRVFHKEQLERMQDCDVYIELFQPTLDGREYGCYGVTAFEAAAMGKPVITMCKDKEVYESAFGLSPFLIANTVEELRAYVNVMNAERVLNSKDKIRQHMVDNHSFEASGLRLYNILKQ